jgi:selenocysteine-specific elongation factor
LAALQALRDATLALLARFHADQPLRPALGREELKRRLFSGAPEGAFEQALASLADAGRVRLSADGVALARHVVSFSPAEERARDALVQAALAAGFRGLESPGEVVPGADAKLVERVTRVLTAEGRLCRVGDALLLHRDHLEGLKSEVRRRWPPGSRLDVAGVKDLTGLSRKFVIPLLEYLDRERVTRRAGADRVVLS